MLTSLIIAYLALVLLVLLMQRRLLYFPTKLSQDQALERAAAEGFEPWRDRAGGIVGWRLRPQSTAAGIVLIVHGNAGWAADRGYFAQPLSAGASLDVFVLEYPGYGARAGSPTKQSFLAAAESAFELLPDSQPIYIVGESLGAGAACHLAQRYPQRVRGLALFAPFDKLTSVAQHQMRLLPAGWMLWDRFEPANCLKSYLGPVVVILAGADQIIPAKFGQRLYDGYEGPKKLELLRESGHNDIGAQSPDWWKEVVHFWQPHARAPEK
jgi:pimeloyl-ACP methyl ester carboxylesterase